jgi:DNA-binding response OmpR family regulator
MKQAHVLIVDDDEDFAESLAIAISSRGHKVELAVSGEEAIEKFRTQDFDIAFMDVRLSGMNGVESFLEVRRFKPEARVVMMTGFSVEQLLEQAIEGGAWGVLHKPLDMLDVIGMVDKIKPDGILIADDDADFAESLESLLSGHGWKVFVARNGREAIDRISGSSVDILILDLRMPVLSGVETYLELKRIGRTLPTIIVTAYEDEEADTIDRLRSMSVCGIMRKPFDPRALIKSVERLVQAEKE